MSLPTATTESAKPSSFASGRRRVGAFAWDVTRFVLGVFVISGLVFGELALGGAAAARGDEPKPVEPKPAAREGDKELKIEDGFSPLFDGKTFEGWEGNMDVFRIEEGAIVGGGLKRPVARNEFLCTRREYENFELRLQARLIGDGANAGIQLRTKRIPNHHEVIGYQCDMGVVGEKNIWGGLYDESRRKRFLAEPDQAALTKAYRSGDWNDFTIRCEGARIRIWLNGELTVDYRESEPDIARRGVIALQIHGGPPSESWYRNLRIQEIAAQ